jgi:hypothetical protein
MLLLPVAGNYTVWGLGWHSVAVFISRLVNISQLRSSEVESGGHTHCMISYTYILHSERNVSWNGELIMPSVVSQ